MKVRPIDANKLLRVLNSNFGHTGGAAVMKQLIEAQPHPNPAEQRGFYDLDSECGYYEISGVAYWRPLPEPPEED